MAEEGLFGVWMGRDWTGMAGSSDQSLVGSLAALTFSRASFGRSAWLSTAGTAGLAGVVVVCVFAELLYGIFLATFGNFGASGIFSVTGFSREIVNGFNGNTSTTGCLTSESTVFA
ncbi:MAG: hypothetical protein HOI25_09820 [Proteobacteria bacterium]|nr:hypothetical protein [Pseudomonadota bacterium]